MKKLVLLSAIGFLVSVFSFGQNVGIGTTTPNTSALLDVNSTTKGLLVPRMTKIQMIAIAAPVAGLVVYVTDDSSYYTRRIATWQKISYGEDNLWKRINNSIHSQGYSIGVGYNNSADQSYLGQYAPIQVKGVVGNTAALFGADQRGISLVADWPGIYFNSYYNNGFKSMSPGNLANISLSQDANDGGYFQFNFGGYASGYDFPKNSSVKVTLNHDGKMGINMATIPTRSFFEQQGVIGTTAAIFGGEGSGISLQKNWPAIGFNHYYNGTNRSLAAGWLGQLALSQTDGSLAFSTFGDYVSVAPNDDMGALKTQFFISRNGNTFTSGNLSVNNTTDGPPITLRNTSINFSSVVNSGIRFQPDGNFPWNIYCSAGASFNFAFNGARVSYIAGTDGAYYNFSDSTLKKSIADLSTTLNKIDKLRPVTYLLKAENYSDKAHIGFLSQEVENIFPEVIATTNDGIKMMNYSGIIPILTKGIQEQQQEIEAIKNENADLKRRLEKLENIILKK